MRAGAWHGVASLRRPAPVADPNISQFGSHLQTGAPAKVGEQNHHVERLRHRNRKPHRRHRYKRRARLSLLFLGSYLRPPRGPRVSFRARRRACGASTVFGAASSDQRTIVCRRLTTPQAHTRIAAAWRPLSGRCRSRPASRWRCVSRCQEPDSRGRCRSPARQARPRRHDAVDRNRKI